MRNFLCTLTLGAWLCLSPATLAQTAEDYPPDPPGVVVVDRDSLEVWKDQQINFYAVLYTQGEQSFLDVYQGLPWQRIHHWPIEFQGDKVTVPPRSALHIEKSSEDEDLFTFYWNSYGGYREGSVHLSVSYDLKTKTWKTAWSD